ncbi:hypothetical protein MTO96_028205 [Rhipicephalus appendiculatus]
MLAARGPRAGTVAPNGARPVSTHPIPPCRKSEKPSMNSTWTGSSPPHFFLPLCLSALVVFHGAQTVA